MIDASTSGVSGDKYLGALVDLGARPSSLNRVAKLVADNLPGTRSVKVSVKRVERGALGAQLVTIESSESVDKRKGVVVRNSIEKCAERLGLSDWGSKFSLSTVDTLLSAESKVHGHSSKEVELHELGSADTLVDILGTACLVEELRLEGAMWWCTPVAVGGGTSRFSGRTYPNPPPAVAEILRNRKFPMDRGRGTMELTTPTGAAITANLLSNHARTHPSLVLERIGYGAGARELEEVANVLRLMVGENLEESHSHDQIVILETNLDDVTGEIIGRAAERLMDSGAKDVTITPVFMKKNRPGQIVSVIARKEDAERLADVLMTETGTLGVREIPITRHISSRTTTSINLQIKGKDYKVRVKLSRNQKGSPVRGKMEYDDLRTISARTGLSIREIQILVKPRMESLYK
jgi:uncharacterized protein (TIGR00299 family) protein